MSEAFSVLFEGGFLLSGLFDRIQASFCRGYKPLAIFDTWKLSTAQVIIRSILNTGRLQCRVVDEFGAGFCVSISKGDCNILVDEHL